MNKSNRIKEIVKEKYGQIAQKSSNQCCCSCNCSDSAQTTENSIMAESYLNIGGYVPEADLGLGCGIPTKYAGIKAGDTVVDLGSGTGNDVFIARQLVGEAGHVIGIDMTSEMIKQAEKHNNKLGFKNVEFKLGEIEKLPLENNSAHVIVSNCVLNLVPDKPKAFAEIFRVLKPGGHFCVSDIVMNGQFPESLIHIAELYVGCVAGAISQNEYIDIIKKSGFDNITIHDESNITLLPEVLENYLPKDEIQVYLDSKTEIKSLTVTAYKK